MHLGKCLITCGLAAWIVACAACGSSAAADDVSSGFTARVMPVLAAHCASCHGGKCPEAGLTLEGPRTLEQLRTDAKRWFRVAEQLESGAMPPEDEKPLTPAERDAVRGWVRGPLAEWLAGLQLEEGRSRFRRLNRNEYANTILDLFGFRPPVVRELPGDGRVDGYDKISAALPLSSAGAAGIVKMTEDILARMLRPLPPDLQRTYRLWPCESEQSAGHILELPDGTKVSFNTDTTSGPLRLKNADGALVYPPGPRMPGMHKLRLSVYGYQTEQPLIFGIYAGHTVAYPQLLDLVKVLEAPPGKPAVLETEIYLRTAPDSDLQISDHFRLVPFGIGVQVPKNSLAKDCKGPGLAIQWVDVEEPAFPLPGDRWLSADIPAELLEKIRLGDAQATLANLPSGTREVFLAAVEKTLQRIGPALYRRPLADAELAGAVARVARQIDDGRSLREALLGEVAQMMTAPDFLCVIERPGRLNDFALASRLAYFLWNSTPDETLLALAGQNRLSEPAVLRDQTERMLADPKSQRFVNDFLDQWLGLRSIGDTTPDADLYPEYDDVLKISSLLETQASLRRMLDRNLSTRDFVAPSWALVNERLARHYGLAPVPGFALQEIRLPAGAPLGGIWTQAATMKVTANGTLTSPVKRGVWVAERLLGTPIPPPPPNIEPVDPDTRGAKTLREQLALHASKGSCQACHARFDPYGFALESFDVTGALRTRYRVANPDYAQEPPETRRKWREGLPVDCSGTTPDGQPFAGVNDLRQLLARHPERLARGVTRHLLTYATGAPATYVDERAIDAIVQAAADKDYGLRSLVHGVVQSDTFRYK